MQVSKMMPTILMKDFDNAPPYFKEFNSFYDVWLINKYKGGGIKIFGIIVKLKVTIQMIELKFVIPIHTITTGAYRVRSIRISDY